MWNCGWSRSYNHRSGAKIETAGTAGTPTITWWEAPWLRLKFKNRPVETSKYIHKLFIYIYIYHVKAALENENYQKHSVFSGKTLSVFLPIFIPMIPDIWFIPFQTGPSPADSWGFHGGNPPGPWLALADCRADQAFIPSVAFLLGVATFTLGHKTLGRGRAGSCGLKGGSYRQLTYI